MEKTSKLQLPYVLSSQAQKHITHNEALRSLDAIIHLSAISRNQTTPPSSTTDGDRYIADANSTGDWSGKDFHIVAWQDGSWMFYPPQTGWLCWIEDENTHLLWNGTGWININTGNGSLNAVSLIGVNTTADQINKLSVSSQASLFNHEGSDHRLKINKQLSSDTASVLFQNDYTGHAEFGLSGDNDFHMKVSPDGSTFYDGIVVDKDTGHTQCSRLLSGTITITDDSIGEIPTPYTGGFVFLTISDSSWPQIHHSGILAFDTGPSLGLTAHSLGSSMSNWASTTLTGTTGTDGRTNIGVKSGALVIENRFGSTQKFSYTFIG